MRSSQITNNSGQPTYRGWRWLVPGRIADEIQGPQLHNASPCPGLVGLCMERVDAVGCLSVWMYTTYLDGG